MTESILFAGGLIALIAGAELLVRGASRLALSMGLSPLVVGLTVVAFGTSAPELAVSAKAALDGRVDIAVGNVVGSNVFNVLVILGLSAVIAPLVVHMQVIRQEVPIMLGASVLLLVLALDGTIDRTDAALFVLLMFAYTGFLIVQARREHQTATLQVASPRTARAEDAGAQSATPSIDVSQLDPTPGHAAPGHAAPTGRGQRLRADWLSRTPVQIVLVVAGLALLVVGSRWLVDAASTFARAMGVSDLVIGLTIVSAGTSLPELATTALAALRGERDIAVGNAVGSCTFNIFACLGVSGLLAADGLAVAPAVLNFDLWVMLAVAFACVPVALSGREIARWEGGLFLAYYAAYTAYLILAAREHDLLPAFSQVMLSFAVPLTVVTLVVALLHQPAGGEAKR